MQNAFFLIVQCINTNMNDQKQDNKLIHKVTNTSGDFGAL